MPDFNDEISSEQIFENNQMPYPGGVRLPGRTKEDLDFLKARANYLDSQTKMFTTNRKINILQEIRYAINVPMVDEQDHGMGKEYQKLRPAFSEINLGRLQSRYLFLVDHLLKEVDPTYTPLVLDTKYGSDER